MGAEAPAEARRRIAVVEDEADLRRSIVEYLEMEGFDVCEAGDSAGFEALLVGGAVDLALLDLRLPGEDGLSILRALRQGRPSARLPVVMVTAMGDPVDRVVGLKMGADDYVAKPFEFRELLARIRSVLPRAERAGTGAAAADEPRRTVRVGRTIFDLNARRLLDGDGVETLLTEMEFDLLKVLVERPNRVLTRDQLLDLAHDDGWAPFDRSIDIRIARLRKKVEADPARPAAIRTVRGAGYMFVP